MKIFNQIIENILRYTKKKIEVKYADERSGDIKHSLASLKKIKKELNYEPKVYFNEGLIKTYNSIEIIMKNNLKSFILLL